MGVALADIFRTHGAAYCAEHRLCAVQRRALRAVESCRTAALGGHVAACDHCGATHYTYHSCRNRHCPKCQTRASERWLAARCEELLPVPYFHLVFTLPHSLNGLIQGNPAALYDLLFHAASATLLSFGANPRWLGGQLGATLVLHTWGQTLSQHVHLHALVAGGALDASGQWHAPTRGFLFPVKALSKTFRGKFIDGLRARFAQHTLHFAGATAPLVTPVAQQALMQELNAQPWVVYAKAPLAGPAQVLAYLSRYVHRVALSNERLLGVTLDAIRFRYKDYAHGARRRVMRLSPAEFIRRFLLHVLPRGFVRIRHYGLLGSRAKHERLARCRQALAVAQPPHPAKAVKESLAEFWRRVAALEITRCPYCHQGTLHLVQTLPAQRPWARGPPDMSL